MSAGSRGVPTGRPMPPSLARVGGLDCGETEWADVRAACGALDDATRERIGGLSAYYSLYQSRARIGYGIKPGSGYGFHFAAPRLRPRGEEPLPGRELGGGEEHREHREGGDPEPRCVKVGLALRDELPERRGPGGHPEPEEVE